MTPVGQVLAGPPVEYRHEIAWPAVLGATPGDAIPAAGSDGPYGGGVVPAESSTTLDVSQELSGGTGVTQDLQLRHHRMCGRQVSAGGGDPAIVQCRIPWWTPVWGADVGDGHARDPDSFVAIWDLVISFDAAASSYAAGTTGHFFQARGGTGVSAADALPAGASPLTVCGFEAIGDGSGGQTLAYGAWDATGTRLESVQPSGAFDPQALHEATLEIISGRGRGPATLSAWLDGEQLVAGREFGSTQLLTPAGISSTSKILFPTMAVEGGSASAVFVAWRARFGEFNRAGVRIDG